MMLQQVHEINNHQPTTVKSKGIEWFIKGCTNCPNI